MENLAIAYTLIVVVLIGYGLNLWRRSQQVRRERELLESKND